MRAHDVFGFDALLRKCAEMLNEWHCTFVSVLQGLSEADQLVGHSSSQINEKVLLCNGSS